MDWTTSSTAPGRPRRPVWRCGRSRSPDARLSTACRPRRAPSVWLKAETAGTAETPRVAGFQEARQSFAARILCPQAWIEGIAQTIAEQVEPEYGDENGQAGRDRQKARVAQETYAHVEHRAPRRFWWLNPQSQKRKRCFGHDGVAHAQRGQHHQRRDGVGQ